MSAKARRAFAGGHAQESDGFRGRGVLAGYVLLQGWEEKDTSPC